jgi:hypothetical protein
MVICYRSYGKLIQKGFRDKGKQDCTPSKEAQLPMYGKSSDVRKLEVWDAGDEGCGGVR